MLNGASVANASIEPTYPVWKPWFQCRLERNKCVGIHKFMADTHTTHLRLEIVAAPYEQGSAPYEQAFALFGIAPVGASGSLSSLLGQ